MATVELPRSSADDFSASGAARTKRGAAEKSLLVEMLTPLASLRLTVTLLSLSLFLVLAGTLAQIDYDVWKVVHDYFRAWVAWIEVKVFFPRAWDLGGLRFPFPGGKALGVALAVNLLAAHGLRFKITARGGRLLAGLALVAAGAVITYLVIASGANTAIESELTETFTNNLWHAMRAGLGAAALTLAYVMALTRQRAWQSDGVWLWWFGAALAALLLGMAIYLFANPDVRLDPAGLRILWQLAKATSASIVLAVGCWALFGKRGGVVLLHGGIALLMFGELYTAQYVGEAQMRITEGQTISYAEDIRSYELAVTDVTDPKKDLVTVIPGVIVDASAPKKDLVDGKEAVIEEAVAINDDALPFAVRIVELMPNATTRRAQPGEATLANAGLGQLRVATSVPVNTGVSTEQTPDAPAALVELLKKDKDGKPTTDSLGTYLLWPFLGSEVVEVDGKTYNVSLRYTRVPKDYSITLKKFKFDKYEGSDTPKNFESVVQLRDPDQNVDVPLSTSMNNPIRYAGETIYQSSYDPNNLQTTVLQVVSNAGWMIPYVACMIIAAGMLVHFLQMVVRFVSRREDEARKLASVEGGPIRRRLALADWRRNEVWIPALVVLLAAGYVVGKARPAKESSSEMKIHEFAKLPVAYGGRTQPMDSLASNALRTLSGKETYEDDRFDTKQPAVRWLLDVITRAPSFREHQVIKVENLDVLQALKLKPRHGFRYSIEELSGAGDEMDRQIELAAAVPAEKRNLTQKKFVELARKLATIRTMIGAFSPPQLDGATQDEVRSSVQQTIAMIQQLNDSGAPRPVPPVTPEATWRTMLDAETASLIAKIAPNSGQQEDDAALALRNVLSAYADGKPQQFNTAVADYRDIVKERAIAEARHEDAVAVSGEQSSRKPAERLRLDRIEFEAYFNNFGPFTLCIALYITAFVLAVMAWLGWPEGFNRTANWLLWFTFALHTFGLIGRIYISGRPPITNLYSSAVFIGWAAVFFALLFEVIYKLGVGNLLAAALGFPTMIIAYYLTFDNDGDTIGVMQAVLDTNFWLATHVVCITLGYATTLLAGALGILTIVLGLLTGQLNDYQRKQLTRMTYGTICFAIFFSFIGTILGGLWADDSWGRFWGWDPKENGALMIVIWNAIVLHARWGKMVGERGLAALAVCGNIVTLWSWFGVNEMGVGLHSYGFTEGRTFWLGAFMLSQLGIVAVAYAWPLITGASGNGPRGGASAAAA
ncbi:cytochrome c biogenesis protein [Lacipirellula limnantheis]|uniref:Cytochrome c biogenesis protein CcsA n=1 Tax=Lacipirellula limnantheis TaxID=2528024 RepID=A0A517U009_9BACT|nr:cytochrome c biogenesis protein CcsA [Lacipirellula limnantheis]QDT73956.1 Cytochrome c biogenesis protein CcsA [Lacipirellula limnantheis]